MLSNFTKYCVLKIILNFCFWFCVGISFPIMSIFAHEMGLTKNLDDRTLTYIFKYFDSIQFYGVFVGVIIFLFIMMFSIGVGNLLKIIFNNKSITPLSTAVDYALKELRSQSLSVGSIILVINCIFGGLFGYSGPH